MNDVIESFRNTVDRNALAPAVFGDGKLYSYGDLSKRSQEYASFFYENNLERVCIALKQSFECYAAILGAMQVEVTYCPYNLESNLTKLKVICDVFEPKAIVSEEGLLADFSSKVAIFNTHEIISKSDNIAVSNFNPLSIAYVIFTSGSTGEPKGVSISRGALSNYLKWVTSRFPISSGMRWSQHPNIGFDLSVLDVYGALCLGATLYPLVSAYDRLFPARFIKKHSINIWNSTPSVLEVMVQSGDVNVSNLNSLHFITCCGEPLKNSTVRKFLEVLPGVHFQNTYGPTEATVSCSEYQVVLDDINDEVSNTVELGEPIDGMGFHLEAYSTNQNLFELYLYGKQLSSGYIKRDDLNHRAFVNRKIDGQQRRCYKTGDLVSLVDRKLFYHSRIDSLCKVKGKLVDLQELENALASIYKQTFYVVSDSRHIVVFTLGREHNLQSIRSILSKQFSEYELPDKLVLLDAFPFSGNDKVDKNALLEMIEK